MAKVKYVLIGFGGIAENRVAKEGYACDKKRFKPLKTAQLVGATDMNPARQAAAEALGLKWYASLDEVLADKTVDGDPKEIVEAFRDMGILALTAHGNVVRFLPTLSMSEKHLEEAVEMMGDALDGLYGEEEP